MKKKVVFAALGLLILIAGIFLVASAVNKAKQWHPDSSIRLKVDETEKTLQEVISENLFTGSHSYASVSSVNGGEHDASKVWVSVNGNEETLLDALKTTGLYGNQTTTSYSGPEDKSKSYHYADEIEVNICGTAISLQEAIDQGKIAKYSWVEGECSVFCGGGTRTISCQKDIDGTTVSNACCNLATKPSQLCNDQACIWQMRYPPKGYVKDYNCGGHCTYGSCSRDGGINAIINQPCAPSGAEWTCCTVVSGTCFNYAFDCK
jgi:hypothetical protein